MQALRSRHKQRRTNAILTAATELFRARGYERTCVTDIADAANLSVGTLYNYFPGKAAIAFAIFETDRRIVREREQQVIDDPSLDPLERLSRFIEADVFFGFDGVDLQTWSEIEAMSVVRTSELGGQIKALNEEIIATGARLLQRMAAEGSLAGHAAGRAMARLMFYIGRVHCLEVISDPSVDDREIRRLIREEVRALFGSALCTVPTERRT